MYDLNIRVDFKALTATLNSLERKQIPFAMATAATNIAKGVKAAELAAFPSAIENPTPFTMNAVGVIPATRATLTATVFVKDIQAAYLLPMEMLGPQRLGAKQAILTPRDQAVNQYGNIPKGKLASLRGRPDIFIGEVKTKDGKTISGVWQRPTVTPVGKRAKGIKGLRNLNRTGRLKLLVQFTNPAQLTHPLGYRSRAKNVAARLAPVEAEKAMTIALATAR